MPTAPAFIPSDVNAAVARVTKLNERVIDAGKRLGTVYLDGCRKTVAPAISGGRETSGRPLEVVRTLVKAEAEVAGELTKTYTAMVRDIVPA